MTVVTNYQQHVTTVQSQLVSDYMASVIIDKATALDMSYYENAAFHNNFHQAQRQSLYRPVLILRNLSELFKSSLLLLSLSSLIIILHWGVAIILILFAIPIAAVKWYYSTKMYEWEINRTAFERESVYLSQVLTTDAYAKEVRIFNLANPLKAKFKTLRELLYKEKYKISNKQAQAGVLAKGAEILAMTCAYGYIAFKAFHGQITIGDLVMFFQAFQRGQSAIQQLLGAGVGLYNNRLFLTQLFDLLEMPSILQESEEPIELEGSPETLSLEQVSFIYPYTDVQVLTDITLTLRKGQVIALVGENGSGKTTLIKLLCRLYDPTSGIIKWDGTDITKVSLTDLRSRISVIYQDFSKYHFTVGENIAIGDYADEMVKEHTVQAATYTGAHDFISELPEQYDQQLGRWFKGGHELSGGQWQKIALSRAFYKDADIIILDEPSSSIDPLAEASIFQHFRATANDKILSLITHRIYNLKMADQIVVLDGGHIVEIGDHKTLMDLQGTYKAMFDQQSS